MNSNRPLGDDHGCSPDNTAAAITNAKQRDTEGLILALAARQQGVVAREHLLSAGVAPHAIDYRVQKGRLVVLHRGVYRVGPVQPRHEREMAALLACGAGAVLSHRSAAALWSLLPYESTGRVEVSVARFRVVGRNVCVHRVVRMDSDEVAVAEGLPVTSPARTILDLAEVVGTRDLEQSLAQAERQGLEIRPQLDTLLARYPRRPGRRVLRALLGEKADPALTRSEAESRFLALLRKAQLPAPETDVRVRDYEVDLFWKSARLIVEIDGRAFHSSSRAFENDRRRDAVLTAAGFRVVRVTWRQLSKEPEAVVARLAQALVVW